jgi:hypothetical protein
LGAKLLIRSSVGTVESLTYIGNGVFTGRYTPPAVNFPQVGLVTVVDERAPSSTYGAYAVRLSGQTPGFPVRSVPNATVIVRIDGRDFGPYPTDATGAAKVPIKVPPGMTTAKLITVVNGQTTEAPLDLKIPETRRIALFPTQAAIPGDPKAAVPVRAYVVTPGGQPDAAAKVKFSVSVGSVGDAKHVGNGVYEAMWTPAAMPAGGKANLTANIDGGAAMQTDTVEVLLAPLRPGSLSVTADPTSLPAGATGFKVFTKLNALDGTGLPGREVMYVSGAARPQAASKDLKGGDYETLFVTNSGESVRVVAVAAAPVSGNRLRHVIVLPSEERLPNDSRSQVALTILSVDEFGYAVPQVPVNLKLSGDGQLIKQVTTDDRGVATVYYTAGKAAGLVTVRAQAGDVGGAAALLQVPAGVAAGVDLPDSGSAELVAARIAASKLVRELVVPRQGVAGVAAPNESSKAGPVSSLDPERHARPGRPRRHGHRAYRRQRRPEPRRRRRGDEALGLQRLGLAAAGSRQRRL